MISDGTGCVDGADDCASGGSPCDARHAGSVVSFHAAKNTLAKPRTPIMSNDHCKTSDCAASGRR
jgi:hypothetical protein